MHEVKIKTMQGVITRKFDKKQLAINFALAQCEKHWKKHHMSLSRRATEVRQCLSILEQTYLNVDIDRINGASIEIREFN